jgi:dipeptidase E
MRFSSGCRLAALSGCFCKTMRLVLYSDQEIAANAAIDERLLRLIGVRRPRIGYVSSAPDPDRCCFDHKRSYYANRGADLAAFLDADTLDLERDLVRLIGCDAIHLAGGNTFSFLRWLTELGVLPVLRTYALDGGVLIGASAGSILMTPAVGTAALCGDEHDPGLVHEDALGLVDFHFWPHYRPGAEFGAQAQSILRQVVPLYGCPDGSGIVIDGPHVEHHGAVRMLSGAVHQPAESLDLRSSVPEMSRARCGRGGGE